MFLCFVKKMKKTEKDDYIVDIQSALQSMKYQMSLRHTYIEPNCCFCILIIYLMMHIYVDR